MSPTTLLLTWLSIALVAFVVLVGGFVLGHDFHAGHGFHAEGDGAGSVFSTRVLGTFALGLGAAGAIATLGGLSGGAALASGLFGGSVLGGTVWVFLYFLSSQQGSMLVATSELVGRLGVVVTAIGRNAAGEVGVSRGESLATFLARAHSGSAIARGQSVRVVRVAGSLLFVEEASPFCTEPVDSNRR